MKRILALALLIVAANQMAFAGVSTIRSANINDDGEVRQGLVGATLGIVGSPTAVVSESRNDSYFMTGLDAAFYIEHWGLAASYSYFSKQTGEGLVTVDQANHWVLIEGHYRFGFEDKVYPEIFFGVGPYIQGIYTNVAGQVSSETGINMGFDIGAGLVVDLSGPWSMEFKGKLYRYSNVTGLQYLAGLQYLF